MSKEEKQRLLWKSPTKVHENQSYELRKSILKILSAQAKGIKKLVSITIDRKNNTSKELEQSFSYLKAAYQRIS